MTQVTKKVVMSHIKLELLSSDLLVTKVKNNPNINTNQYMQILETRTLASIRSYGTSRNSPSFSSLAIGLINGKYDGYRLITKEEANTNAFLLLFKQEYNKFGGIYSLDDFTVDLVCCKGYNFCGRGCCSDYLTGRNGSRLGIAIKHTIFRELRTLSAVDMKVIDIEVGNHEVINARDNTGIFVAEKLKF